MRIMGFGFRVSGFGLRASGFGFRVSGFGFRVSGFDFLVSGFCFRVSGVSGGPHPEREDVRGLVLRPVLAHRQPATTHRKVDIRLHGKGNANSHGARPVY